MKKKLSSFTIKISIIIAVAVTVMFGSIIASTAKVMSMISTDSSMRLTSWWFTVNVGENTYNPYSTQSFVVSLSDTVTSTDTLSNGKIAPGSSGSFTFYLDFTNCETDFEWSIEFSLADPLASYPPIVFTTTYGADEGETVTIDMTDTEFTGSFTYSAATASSQVLSMPISWNWPVVIDGTDDYDGISFGYRVVFTITQS